MELATSSAPVRVALPPFGGHRLVTPSGVVWFPVRERCMTNVKSHRGKVSENRSKISRKGHNTRWLLTSLPCFASLGSSNITDVTDRIRLATQTLYQELIDAEATAFIGAASFERSEERNTHRNGSRPRILTTTAGELDLRIPKLRAGRFFPALLERRRRIDQASFAVVMLALVAVASWLLWKFFEDPSR